MKHWLLIVLFTAFLFRSSLGQVQQVKFTRIPQPKNVPWAVITSITQDPKGYMWFTSGPFLCRYDGIQIVPFRNDPLNQNSVGGVTLETVYADSKGMIWIGFLGSGLDRYNTSTGEFTHFRHNPGDANSLINDTVAVILEDHEGVIWVGTHRGLDQFDQHEGKFRHFQNDPGDTSSLSHNLVRALYQDHQGTVWVGTGDPFFSDLGRVDLEGGLNRFDRATGKFTRYLHDPNNPHSLIDNRVRAIFEDSKGTFWVGTAGDGLHTMDRANGTFERHTYDPAHPEKLSRPALNNAYSYVAPHICFIKEDAAGGIWIGTIDNGINRYDPGSRTVTHYDEKDSTLGFKANSGWAGFVSRDGIVWVGTWDLGSLYRIDPSSVTIPEFREPGGVNDLYQESDRVWAATNNGLLLRNETDGSTKRFIEIAGNPESISNNNITTICGGSSHDLWLGTFGGGVNHFDIESQHFTRYRHNDKNPNSIASDSILAICTDKDGSLWIGSFEGLDHYDPKNRVFTHYHYDRLDSGSLSQQIVRFIMPDGNNGVWVASIYSSNGGLNLLDRKTGKFKHYLKDIDISQVFRDSEGVLWAASFFGLLRYDPVADVFYPFIDPTSGSSFSRVSCILEDTARNLWISASDGIYRLNSKRNESTLFGREQGVEGYQGNDWKGFKGSNNKLFFGSPSGYYAFFPDRLQSRQKPPEILLSAFRINDQIINSGKNGPLLETLSDVKELRLKYNQNVFSFDFTTIDYHGPEDNRQLFMLENYDNTWHPSGTERRASFFSVPPGHYVLHLKASNANGIWSERIINIIISPPWWKTWWAYLSYGLIIGVAIWSFVAYRSRQLKRENKHLEQKVVQRTSQLEQKSTELEASLTNLKAAQAQLIQSEKMASLGELTAGIAHEIQNPLNFVNNFSEVNSELLAELKGVVAPLPDEAKKQANEILDDLTKNFDKINFHGKRADSIVKGMLQHSRHDTGIKEPTDINALADEYFRLSYHGLRAKDKLFNATMKTELDPAIGKIDIIPPEIGRVLLNIYNNAFYAVMEKKKQQPSNYEPTVVLRTKKVDNLILIFVKDNGAGIPTKVMEKIFQPFFTTKPTGTGTGLGLSLSYEIVKAHGGQILVTSEENAGTIFTIELPEK